MSRRISMLIFALLMSVLALGAEGAPAPSKEKAPRPLRVLLFASSPTREYQFLRSLLVRQTESKQAVLSIALQPPPGKEPRKGIVQDVPKERLFDTLPTQLDSYDAIVAFDPDWTRLSADAQNALHKWIKQKRGRLIVIAGPINTPALARAALRDKLRTIIDLYPVVVADNRREERSPDTSKPRRLHFPKTKEKYPFLKLDGKGKDDRAGWPEFFDGDKASEAKKDAEPERGFFSYYPVEKSKPDAVVLAALADPKAKLKDGKEQPYLAMMPVGSGRVVYLGSGEMWRLRQYRQAYYEHFWLGLLAQVVVDRIPDSEKSSPPPKP